MFKRSRNLCTSKRGASGKESVMHARGLFAATLRQVGKNHVVGSVLLLAFLLNVSPLQSQSLEHLWSQRLGGTGDDSVNAIAVV